jgi:hypothetical protein
VGVLVVELHQQIARLLGRVTHRPSGFVVIPAR